jgi:hypothetical protein
MIDASSMAFENHRHFALRKPRCLRRSVELLITTGPFFDDWGRTVARALEPAELAEVVEALQHGWDRLPKTIGYGRALRGILEVRTELKPDTSTPARRALFDTPQDRFEKRWHEEALRLLDDIPSRA